MQVYEVLTPGTSDFTLKEMKARIILHLTPRFICCFYSAQAHFSAVSLLPSQDQGALLPHTGLSQCPFGILGAKQHFMPTSTQKCSQCSSLLLPVHHVRLGVWAGFSARIHMWKSLHYIYYLHPSLGQAHIIEEDNSSLLSLRVHCHANMSWLGCFPSKKKAFLYCGAWDGFQQSLLLEPC